MWVGGCEDEEWTKGRRDVGIVVASGDLAAGDERWRQCSIEVVGGSPVPALSLASRSRGLEEAGVSGMQGGSILVCRFSVVWDQ